MPDQRSCSCKLLRDASYFWDYFSTPGDVISGQYSVHRPLTLNLTLKVKCQVKGTADVACDVSFAPREIGVSRHRVAKRYAAAGRALNFYSFSSACARAEPRDTSY